MADVSKINGYNLKDASARQELNNKADKEHTHSEYAQSSALNSKQDKLVSGSNIKTINGKSVLGSGDITISGGDVDLSDYATKTYVDDAINNAQLGEGDVEYTSNIYANFKGKCVSILGDSISTYVEADGTRWIPSGWVVWYGPKGVSESGKNQLQVSGITDVNLTWWKQTLNTMGMKLCTNASWSGSTVCGSSSDSTGKVGSSTKRIQSLTSDGVIKSEMPAGTTPDIIIIFIGINDFSLRNYGLGSWDMKSIPAEGSYNTFSEAYGLMLGKVMKAYPMAEVFCCTLLETTMSNYEDTAGWPTNSTSGLFLKDYNDKIVEIAHLYGANIIDLHACGVNYFNMNEMTGDKLHPNVYGANLMARKAVAEIYAKSVYGHGNIMQANAPNYYTVTYKYVSSDGKTLKADTTNSVKEGTVISVSTSNASAITGYTVASVSQSGSITVNQNITITYTYNINQYTITYKYVDTDGNTVKADTTATVKYNDVLTISKDNAPDITNYEIESVLPSGNITVTSNVTVTYTYLDISKVYYDVTYKYVDDSGNEIQNSTTQKVLEGTAIEIPTSPSISNYVFVSANPSGSITINQNTTVTYTYRALENYTVTYRYIDGDGVEVKQSTTQTVQEGTNVTIPNAPSIDDYVFVSASHSGNTTINEDLTVTYTYRAVVMYTVTYRYVDGSGAEIQQATTQTVSEGTSITIANAPVIDGHEFVNASHSGSIIINENLTVTYTYKTSTMYNVTYKYVDTNGQTVQEPTTEQVVEGTTITVNTSFLVNGYNFVSVSPSGSIVVNSDIEITVTFELNMLIDASNYKDNTWVAYGTGEESTLTNWRCTDFIEIAEFATAVYVPDITAFNNGTAITTPISFYDENQAWIDGFQSPKNNATTTNKGAWRNELQMDIPEGAKYVRFCWTTEMNYKHETTGVNNSRLYNITPEWVLD